MKNAAVVLGCFVPCVVNAETRICRDFDLLGSATGSPQIVANTAESNGIGSIEIDGTTHSARHEVLELNGVWLWGGGPDGTSPYAFRIHPDGSGALFDLGEVEVGEIAPAAQRFVCEQG